MEKKRIMPKKYISKCIYCGNEFLSSKKNAKYDKNSCKALYFQEKQAFNGAMEQEAVRILRKTASQYAESLIKLIKERIKSRDRFTEKDLDEMTMTFEKGSKFLRETFVNFNAFDTYLQEKNQKKELAEKSKRTSIKKIKGLKI